MAYHRHPGARVRVALAVLSIVVIALAGCAGQNGEQPVRNEQAQAAGEQPGALNEEYAESTPSADPTTAEQPDRPKRPATTAPATRRPARQPAVTTEAPEPPAAGDRTTTPPAAAGDRTTAPPAAAGRETTRPPRTTRPTTRPPVTTGPPQPGRTTQPPVTTGPPQPPGLEIGPDRCDEGNGLQPHDGFQNGNRCVDTQMGEVGEAADNPSLLITDAPERVGVGQPFTIRVSTRNLIRDRFLPAGQGGYYVEMSLLAAQGLVHGHFHTSCRILTDTGVAPDPAPVPAFFVATEDSQGGAEPDVIEIRVPGLNQAGTFQCSAWAGDSSHRVPMMQRANQIPAFDSVRVQVR